MNVTFTKTTVVVRDETFGTDEQLVEVRPSIDGTAAPVMYFGPSDSDERIQLLVEDSLRRQHLIP